MDRIPSGHPAQPCAVSTPSDPSQDAGLRLLQSQSLRLLPPRSCCPRHAEALAREVGLRWAKPAAKAPPWLRESFPRRRPPVSRLWAFTVDCRGRVVRAFTADQLSIAAYSELQRQCTGTCPIEAIWPPSIAPGCPAEPAHPHVLQLMQGVAL